MWLAGAWLLAHRLARGVAGHASFILLTAIGAAYGGWSIFYAGESVLSPRTIAEGLAMIGLVMAYDRAWLRAAAALMLAGLFHPAMALAGIGAAFLVVAMERPLAWWLVPAAAAVVLALAVIRVPPFDGLVTSMNGIWLARVADRNGFLFAGEWLPGDWARVAANLAICAAAAFLSRGVRRRLFIAVCLGAVAGLAVTVVGADFARDALIVQLQTWRMTWLLAVATLPAIVLVALRLRRRPLGWPAVALLAAPLVVLTLPFSSHAWAWVTATVMSAAGLTLAWLIHRGRQPKLSATASRIVVELAFVLPFATAVDSLINLAEDIQFRIHHSIFAVDPMSFIGARIALLAAGLALLWLARRRTRLATAICALGICAGALIWDGRSPWERYIESGAPSPLAALPPGATLLWGREAAPTWLLLRRPVYVSDIQATGSTFSRPAAVEWDRRAARVRPLVKLDAWSPERQTCDKVAVPVPATIVASVCRNSLGLTGIVLGQPVAGGRAVAFTTPVAEPQACNTNGQLDQRGVRQFYYVSCADLVSARTGRP